MKFSFENLEVYQRSIDWVKTSEDTLERNRGKISRSLADQLSRAALSIPLNIAEGNGRWHKGDKRNFFWIARGSVFECIPIVEILHIKNLINTEEHEAFRQQLEVLGKMLTRLIHSQSTKSSTSKG